MFINLRYTLEKILGSGGFGYIYIVTDEGSKRKAVMKVVSLNFNFTGTFTAK